MQTRHTNELISRLEHATDIGVAEIGRTELLRWYGQERLTTSVWRDIAEKWSELLTDDDIPEDEKHLYPLFVGETGDLFILLAGTGLKVDPDSKAEKWIWPIDEWVKVKERKPRSKPSTTAEGE